MKLDPRYKQQFLTGIKKVFQKTEQLGPYMTLITADDYDQPRSQNINDCLRRHERSLCCNFRVIKMWNRKDTRKQGEFEEDRGFHILPGPAYQASLVQTLRSFWSAIRLVGILVRCYFWMKTSAMFLHTLVYTLTEPEKSKRQHLEDGFPGCKMSFLVILRWHLSESRQVGWHFKSTLVTFNQDFDSCEL